MLTQEQKDKLHPLTLHPKFGKLLIEAIKGWENSTPKTQDFGISRFDSDPHIMRSTWKLNPNSNKCCCLIGSAILGKDSSYGIISSAMNNFSLSEKEVNEIINGFDYLFSDSEGHNFGNSVSKIIFGE